MRLPLQTTFLLKIPYFDMVFGAKYEGFEEDFVNYYNHVLETNPEENLRLFQEFYKSDTDYKNKSIIHNMGIYYLRYQKAYWSKRPANTFNFSKWEKCFDTFLPTYNDEYSLNISIEPKWNRLTETYEQFIIGEPLVNQHINYIEEGLDMMFLNETVPANLLPAFALSTMIIYYKYKSEIENLMERTDPTYKII